MVLKSPAIMMGVSRGYFSVSFKTSFSCAALQMKVVDDQDAVIELQLRDQSHPPSQAPLKQRPCREERLGLPKSELQLEPQGARRLDGERREGGLAVERRPIGRALPELLKFRRESEVHIKALANS